MEHRVMTQSCDGDWVRYGDSCYRYYTSQMAWIYAFKTCQSDNGFLTDIENADEQAFLQNLTSRAKFWISASDSVGDWFKWMWYGGIHPWGYTNWDTAFYLTEDPVLTLAVEASSNETRLICAFIFNISDVDFSVEWYLNDKMKCVVTPCMPGNCSMRGSSRESNVISAKIQVW
uniref:C-type lectin domain family 10 member A n=1 Tax=Magallana gigas TaxID=29159 RepID=K1QJM9_MAGGI